MEITVTNVLAFGSMFISLYLIIKKDNSKLGSMETKIDMLLLNSNESKADIKEHAKILSKHDTEISNVKQDVSYLQDTLRIRKVMGEIKE